MSKILYFCLTFAVICGAVTQLDANEPPETIGLGEYLSDVGNMFDVYFCIELQRKDIINNGVHHIDADNSILQRRVPKNHRPDNLPEALTIFSEQNPDLEIIPNRRSDSLFSIVDKQLLNRKEYAVEEKPMEFIFDGTFEELLKHLHEYGIHIYKKRAFLVPEEPMVRDLNMVTIRSSSASVRDILSLYLPLHRYGRVLWIGMTFNNDTEIYSYGILGMNEHGLPKDIQYIPFYRGANEQKLGDITTKEVIASAIAYVGRWANTRHCVNVRWALLALGGSHSADALPTLFKYLDFKYTNYGRRDEKYPALSALENFGEKAVESIIEHIREEKNMTRVALLCDALVLISGIDKASSLIGNMNVHEEGNIGVQEAAKHLVIIKNIGSNVELIVETESPDQSIK
jgi:hypothetical protein